MARERATIRAGNVPLADRTTYVYRAYGTRNQLLYVGISQSWRHRIEGHIKSSDWWPYTAHIEISEHPNRAEAFAAESWAIKHERPLCNLEPQRAHVPDDYPQPALSFGQAVTRWKNRNQETAKEVDYENPFHQAGILAVG